MLLSCGDSLSGKDMAIYIRNFCDTRVKKYGIYSTKSGACKGCPYRYRGANELLCCMFDSIPYTWKDEDIDKNYPYKSKS